MSNKNIIYIKRNNKPLKIDVCVLQDWDGFNTIIKFIENHYDVTVLKKADGPDARRWILEINGEVIELIHDDMTGNFIIATSETSEKILYEIGNDLENELKLII